MTTLKIKSLSQFSKDHTNWLNNLKIGDKVLLSHYCFSDLTIKGALNIHTVERFTSLQIALNDNLKVWKSSGTLVEGKCGNNWSVRIFPVDFNVQNYRDFKNMLDSIQNDIRFYNLSFQDLQSIQSILENAKTHE